MKKNLSERLFDFAVKVIKYCRTLKKTKENEIIVYQLVKVATSSGSNYEEAQSASSRADFKWKIDITLREMRESNYWLRILRAIGSETQMNLELIVESEELKKILGSISSKLSIKRRL